VRSWHNVRAYPSEGVVDVVASAETGAGLVVPVVKCS
jgi:hypothetical protein